MRNRSFPDRLKAFRKRQGLTQEGFVEKYPIPLATLRSWEQGVNEPGSVSRILLALIEKEPKLMANLIAKHGLV